MDKVYWTVNKITTKITNIKLYMIKSNVKSMAVYLVTRLCDLNCLEKMFKLNTSLVSQKVPIHVLSSLTKIVSTEIDGKILECFVSSQRCYNCNKLVCIALPVTSNTP